MSSTADLPPDEGSADADRVTAELGEISAELARLGTLLDRELDREHERAAHREAIIDRLHEDNQLLRRGELQELQEPVRTALYRLHDMIKRESERWAAPEPPDPTHVAPLLTAIADEIAEAVARTGVERFTVKPGDRYDSARHRPVATEPVADPGLDGAIVTARTDGFERGDRVVRRAEVVVGRFTPDEPPQTPPVPPRPRHPRHPDRPEQVPPDRPER